MISTAPGLAGMNASPVTQAGSERPDRRKSRLLETDLRARGRGGAAVRTKRDKVNLLGTS
jgi:hypothetical protein